MGRKAIQGVFKIKIPVWATRTQVHWKLLGHPPKGGKRLENLITNSFCCWLRAITSSIYSASKLFRVWAEGNPAANVLVVRNAQKCRGLGKDGHTHWQGLLICYISRGHMQETLASDAGMIDWDWLVASNS